MTERTTSDPESPSVSLDGGGPTTPVGLTTLPDDPAAFAEDAESVGAFIRLLAYALDAVLLVVAIYLVALVLRAAIGPTLRITDSAGVPRIQVDRLHSLINSLAATLVAGVYFVGSWLRSGGTPGQRLIGARVVHVDGGGRLRPGQAVARWLLLGTPLGLISTILGSSAASSVIPLLALAAWCAVLYVSTARGRRKRGLHDRITGSIVVRRSATPVPGAIA